MEEASCGSPTAAMIRLIGRTSTLLSEG